MDGIEVRQWGRQNGNGWCLPNDAGDANDPEWKLTSKGNSVRVCLSSTLLQTLLRRGDLFHSLFFRCAVFSMKSAILHVLTFVLLWLVAGPRDVDAQRTCLPTRLGRSVECSIMQQSSGRYLDAYQSDGRDYRVVTRPGQGDDTQVWIITADQRRADGSSVYTIKQKSSSRFLDAYRSDAQDFAVVTRPQQGDDTQRWFVNRANGGYRIRQVRASQGSEGWLDAYERDSDDYGAATRNQQSNQTQVWVLERRRGPEPERSHEPASATSAADRGASATGSIFRDCDVCPEMIVLPAGSYIMGSPPSERDRQDDEGPQHRVRVSQFALGRYEVTKGEFNAFVVATTREFVWHFEQSDNAPVVNLSWQDAQAYLRWLGSQTGEEFRMPSEAEWEYAARAGTQTTWHWGDDRAAGCPYANLANDGYVYICDPPDRFPRGSPVGSFQPNQFGLYDMAGNVFEWVEDCYHDSYSGGPTNGVAWTTGDCSTRVIRGGGWNYDQSQVRSAFRHKRDPTESAWAVTGFRVAKTLPR